MKILSVVGILTAVCGLFAAPPANVKNAESEERISKDTLLKKDKLMRFTATKPCWLDKYKYFCCPVRKIVRRGASGKWIDYCYNDREELIGIRKSDYRGSVKRSDFSAIGGCSRCMNTKIRQRKWKHDTNPRAILPKKKKRR